MKKKILGVLLVLVLMLGLTGCGEKAPTKVMESKSIKVNGVYVDESYEDEDGDGLKAVYLFYTVKAADTNYKVSSKDIQIKVNDTNSYSPVMKKDFIPYYTNYYYSDFLEEVYVGKSLNVLATFEVPEGDLKDSKLIKLEDSDISDIGEIFFTTNDVKFMKNMEEISKDLDKKTFDVRYKERQNALAVADEATTTNVRNLINGYYFEFTNYTAKNVAMRYRIDFDWTNYFKLTSSVGTASLSNDGTYEVRNGYIALTYNSNGHTVFVRYELENDDISLYASEAFSLYVDYNPLEEE